MNQGMLGMINGLRFNLDVHMPEFMESIKRRPPTLFEKLQDFPWAFIYKYWCGDEAGGWATFDRVKSRYVSIDSEGVYWCHPITYRLIAKSTNEKGGN